MKNILVVTGGAGFVGSNLIDLLVKKTKYRIISIDDYSSGLRKNHIKNPRIKYIKSNTKNISQILKFHKTIYIKKITKNLLQISVQYYPLQIHLC